METLVGCTDYSWVTCFSIIVGSLPYKIKHLEAATSIKLNPTELTLVACIPRAPYSSMRSGSILSAHLPVISYCLIKAKKPEMILKNIQFYSFLVTLFVLIWPGLQLQQMEAWFSFCVMKVIKRHKTSAVLLHFGLENAVCDRIN